MSILGVSRRDGIENREKFFNGYDLNRHVRTSHNRFNSIYRGFGFGLEKEMKHITRF